MTTHLCRCGHPEDYHHTDDTGIWYCVGMARIDAAHPDYEPCDCTNYRPRPEPQGRML